MDCHILYLDFNTMDPIREDFVIAKFLKSALKNEYITIYGDGFRLEHFAM